MWFKVVLRNISDPRVWRHQPRQVLVVQKVQKTVEVPQGQHMDRIVDVTVVLQHQVPTSHTVQKTAEVSTVRWLRYDQAHFSALVSSLEKPIVAESSSAAEPAFEAADPLNCKFTLYAFCREFGFL